MVPFHSELSIKEVLSEEGAALSLKVEFLEVPHFTTAYTLLAKS